MAKAKQTSKARESTFILSAGGCLLAAYLMASWAIDSGSIVAYFLAFLAIFYAVYFTKEWVRVHWSTDDKTTATKRARRAH